MPVIDRQSTDDDIEFLLNAAITKGGHGFFGGATLEPLAEEARTPALTPAQPVGVALPPISALPESLLMELQSVSERVQKVVWQESHKLALERAALEAEKRKQAEVLAERQFAVRRDQHALVAEQQQLRRASTKAADVEGYQDQRVCLMVGGTPFPVAVPTLCGKAPNSALAQLVRRRLAEHIAQGQTGTPQVFIDREPSAMHWLLRWLREAPPPYCPLASPPRLSPRRGPIASRSAAQPLAWAA